MQGQDKGIEIKVASDAPSNFIGTVEDPSMAVSTGVDNDDGMSLSSNSNRRSPRKACIKTALAATLVVVAAFAIGYGSGIGIQNAANNKNEGLVSSAKNQALQEVPSSAVGSKSSKYSKSAKDDLINALLARVEALEEGQQAFEDGQQALEDGQQALEDGQQALEDGQQALEDALAGVLPCVGYDNSTDVCTIGKDVEAVFIEPREAIKLITKSGNAIRLKQNGGIKLEGRTFNADIVNTITLVAGKDTNDAKDVEAVFIEEPTEAIRLITGNGNAIRLKQNGGIKLEGRTLNADIDNSITLEAGKDINLASGGDLVADIDGGVTIDTSEGDINLLAPGGDLNAGIANDFNLLAGGDLNAVIVNDFNLQAGDFNLLAGGDLNAVIVNDFNLQARGDLKAAAIAGQCDICQG